MFAKVYKNTSKWFSGSVDRESGIKFGVRLLHWGQWAQNGANLSNPLASVIKFIEKTFNLYLTSKNQPLG